MGSLKKTCDSCRAPIRLVQNSRSGKWMAVNASPISHDGSPELVVVIDGNYVICTRQAIRGEIVYRPHWLDLSCPRSRERLEQEKQERAAQAGSPQKTPQRESTSRDDRDLFQCP